MHSLTIALQMMKRTLGRKKGWMVYVLLPCAIVTVCIALLGQANTAEVPIAYINEDQGPAGEHLLQELGRTEEYVMKPAGSVESLKNDVIEKTGLIAFTIPKDFSQQLLDGGTPNVEIYEIAVSEASFTVKMKLEGVTGRIGEAAAVVSKQGGTAQEQQAALKQILDQTAKHQIKAVTTDLELYARPGLNNITGFTLLFLMSLVASTVMLMVEDRKLRTMSRIYTAPVRTYEIVLGNFLGSFALGSLQILIVLLVSKYVLGYDYGVPFGIHFVILAAFMLVAMGMASAIAGLIRNPKNAGMLNSLIITPTCMLGGCFWPLSVMPDFLQKIANFVPQKWAIEAVETIASGGALSDIALPLLILGLMAVILLALGSVIMRPSESAVRG
ncbi:ABC transporter permease [Paenibacillus lemnae]|uniref:ABC transporter permease n=1 Tax=Paenibacillus lemnae TaxID=1330551 RepID=A0A848M929_PAELE|nr:ABC transporter permease [Paenibacillus lemnae]NMO96680.1 ABC transporter permease [Paenibacillus lemnae]